MATKEVATKGVATKGVATKEGVARERAILFLIYQNFYPTATVQQVLGVSLLLQH